MIGISIPFAVLFIGDNSEGIRTGVPVNLSNKGWIFKLWEGEMSVQGTQEGLPYIWEFSVCDGDPEKIDIINNAIRNQIQLTIEYRSPMIAKLWIQK